MVAGLPPPALRRIIHAHWARPGLPGHMCPSTAPALAPHRCTGSHSTPASPAWCVGGLCRVGGVQCGAAARQLEWMLVPLLNQFCHTPDHHPETACLPTDSLSTHASTTSLTCACDSAGQRRHERGSALGRQRHDLVHWLQQRGEWEGAGAGSGCGGPAGRRQCISIKVGRVAQRCRAACTSCCFTQAALAAASSTHAPAHQRLERQERGVEQALQRPLYPAGGRASRDAACRECSPTSAVQRACYAAGAGGHAAA